MQAPRSLSKSQILALESCFSFLRTARWLQILIGFAGGLFCGFGVAYVLKIQLSIGEVVILISAGVACLIRALSFRRKHTLPRIT